MAAVWAWITGHEVVVVGMLVAVLDFVFAVSPGLASNGILHGLYLWLKGLVTPAS